MTFYLKDAGTIIQALRSAKGSHGCQVSGSTEEDLLREVQALINDNIVGSDILLPLLRAATDVKEQLAILEISARKQHRTFDIKEVIPMAEQQTLKFTYCTKPKTSVFSSAARMTSMTDLNRL
ncbi:hypothetical protein ACHAW5_006901 [Stephanodiscus triporus]|uniref:Uncharacterized protein n=1 Tax=Stephanodiscus triporus TaxID=2934178 RepID=A0ABD3Q8E6_9STRA